MSHRVDQPQKRHKRNFDDVYGAPTHPLQQNGWNGVQFGDGSTSMNGMHPVTMEPNWSQPYIQQQTYQPAAQFHFQQDSGINRYNSQEPDYNWTAAIPTPQQQFVHQGHVAQNHVAHTQETYGWQGYQEPRTVINIQQQPERTQIFVSPNGSMIHNDHGNFQQQYQSAPQPIYHAERPHPQYNNPIAVSPIHSPHIRSPVHSPAPERHQAPFISHAPLPVVQSHQPHSPHGRSPVHSPPREKPRSYRNPPRSTRAPTNNNNNSREEEEEQFSSGSSDELETGNSHPITLQAPQLDPHTEKLFQISPQVVQDHVSEWKRRVPEFDNELAHICQQIRQYHLPIQNAAADQILQSILKLKSKLTQSLQEGENLVHQTVLPSRQLYELEAAQQSFRRHLAQAELYSEEVLFLRSSNSYSKIFASLFVQTGPHPTTIKQHTYINPIEVRLLQGAKSNLTVMGPVKAEMVCGATNGKKSKSMEGNEEYLQHGQTVANFSKLKILVGTACKTATLKFSVVVQQTGYGSEKRIESAQSDCFVVITNTKQWAEAQGIILKKQIFSGKENHCSQQYFCNCVHKHYLQATKQNPLSYQRTLLPSEFKFLLTRKLQRGHTVGEVVTQTDFDEFWEWFGAALQKIRYQKFLLPMWSKGLFWGFVSKAQSEEFLQSAEVGVFLLRFSETTGSIAIAYKQGPNTVCHYRTKPSDFLQGRSLPQYIRETDSLRYFLQLSTNDTFFSGVNYVDKTTILKQIGGKRRKTTDTTEDPDIYDLVIKPLDKRMASMSLDPRTPETPSADSPMR